jgi:hypothetical protein
MLIKKFVRRKVDWPRYFSWPKIYFEELALVAGTKQRRHTPTVLSACLLCFMPITSAYSMTWIFAAATNSFNLKSSPKFQKA